MPTKGQVLKQNMGFCGGVSVIALNKFNVYCTNATRSSLHRIPPAVSRKLKKLTNYENIVFNNWK